MSVRERNNVNVRGSERALAFTHGFGCHQNMWRFVAAAFESGYQTVLLDFVGSGASDCSVYDRQKYSTLHDYARDMIEIAADVSEGPVVFGPCPCYLNDSDYLGGLTRQDENYSAWAAKVAPVFMGNPDRPDSIARRFAEVTFFSDCSPDLPLLERLSLSMRNSTLSLMKATGHSPHVSASLETTAAIKDY
jgi:sigma-B regulation protein RsbQ